MIFFIPVSMQTKINAFVRDYPTKTDLLSSLVCGQINRALPPRNQLNKFMRWRSTPNLKDKDEWLSDLSDIVADTESLMSVVKNTDQNKWIKTLSEMFVAFDNYIYSMPAILKIQKVPSHPNSPNSEYSEFFETLHTLLQNEVYDDKERHKILLDLLLGIRLDVDALTETEIRLQKYLTKDDDFIKTYTQLALCEIILSKYVSTMEYAGDIKMALILLWYFRNEYQKYFDNDDVTERFIYSSKMVVRTSKRVDYLEPGIVARQTDYNPSSEEFLEYLKLPIHASRNQFCLQELNFDKLDANNLRELCDSLILSRQSSLSMKACFANKPDGNNNFNEIFDAIIQAKFESLIFSKNNLSNLTSKNCKALIAVLSNSKLRYLDFSQNNLTNIEPGYILSICSVISRSNIVELAWSYTGNINAIIVLLTKSKLKSLTLCNLDLSLTETNDLTALFRAIKNSNLESLNLSDNNLVALKGEKFDILCEFVANAHLRHLNLSYNSLTTLAKAPILQPEDFSGPLTPRLARFGISLKPSISYEDFEKLCGVIKKSKIDFIYLYDREKCRHPELLKQINSEIDSKNLQNKPSLLAEQSLKKLLPSLNEAHEQGKRDTMEDATSMHLVNMQGFRDQDIPLLLQRVVDQLQAGFNALHPCVDDGTTILIAIIKDDRLHIAYLGDSECAVLKRKHEGNNSYFVFERLVKRQDMHSVIFKHERTQAIAAGAVVKNTRICQHQGKALSVSRSIHSDYSAKKYYPSNHKFMQKLSMVKPIDLKSFSPQDHLILGCDGVTEPDTATSPEINATKKLDSAINVAIDELDMPVNANTLVQGALSIGSKDNVSVIDVEIAELLDLCRKNPGQAIVLNMNDGHGGRKASDYCASNLKDTLEKQILLLRSNALQQFDDDYSMSEAPRPN